MRRPHASWLALLGYLGWLLLPGVPHQTGVVGANLGMVVLPELVGYFLIRSGRRRGALSLCLLGAATVVWGLGNSVWTILFVLRIDLLPFPSVADVFYLAWPPLMAAAILTLPLNNSRTVGRLRLISDSLVLAAGLFATAWPFVLEPLINRAQSPLATVVSCAYTVCDLALLALLLPMAAVASGAWRPVLLRLSGIALLFTVADVSFCVATRFGVYSSTSVITVGWVAAFCAAASVAGVWPDGTNPSADASSQFATRGRRAVVTLVSCVPVLGALASVCACLVSGRLDPVVIVSVVILAGVGTVRHQLTFWEHEALTREPESRVDQRTRQLSTLAYTDLLTGLANRARFHERLQELADEGTEPVLLLLDLDGFKSVNDTLGHSVGDELLAEAAERLRASCPEAVALARLGGDEFAVVLPPTDVETASSVADRILENLAAPFRVGHAEVRVGGSIGIAGGLGGDVLRQADLAMYAAKAAGRNRWRIFDPALGSVAERRRMLEDDLRVALREDQLRLAWQPVVDLVTGDIVGVEALLRWHHPTRGLIPPVEFIPVAEEIGLIVPIGAWVLREACRRTADWKARLPEGAEFCVGLDVSVHQLGADFPTLVERTLEETGLLQGGLVLELTESVFMDDERTDPELLQQLRRLGVMIFLDDFGTGYSSLSYLRRFPVDGLKIDRSFVAGLGPEGDDVISAAVMRIAESLGLAVVAEGIEEPHQRDALLTLGCRLGQGYGLGRPTDEATFVALLSANFPGCFPTVPMPAPRVGQEAVASTVAKTAAAGMFVR